MPISRQVSEKLEKSSWIRKMFEEGLRMKQEHGADNVFDLSLGNPVVEPPEEVRQAIVSAASNTTPGLHRYMPNAGLTDVREAVAGSLSAESGVKLSADHVVMVCGAAGGLNITLKALLDPDEEVIAFSPFFVEYLFYSDNHGGKTVIVPTHEDFRLNFDELRKALSPKTKAVIINSPNNPTGVVYSRAMLTELAEVLRQHTSDTGNPVYLISDDPYKKIVFDEVETPNIMELYENSIYITSHSKDLALPGERIGYVAVHPKCADAESLMSGLIFCNRVLGFVNAPALIQRAVRNVQDVSVDAEMYRKKRDFLYGELTRIGYSVVKPQGAFYLFPKSPIEDEVAFVQKLAEKKVLVVPGRGFGSPGYFRISYCVPDKVLEGSIRGFENAFSEAMK
ncbi:MAG: pyridoxal phosphate-dependent aminotransferase [Nitrospinaceae bacterium]|jgi:aspartate aminotransferase|nr:pyridoxal phosphate-dependent aminotransferase [Nitrospinaceae bacterium]MDP7108898.1 pyridoxal phosphate-dependent aminotransferase [Nitrospinaceae bacterium]|tara:strand:- start:5503 stop:6687 length:1185 start_codon:yes stop_codon:yes gene_type:complete